MTNKSNFIFLMFSMLLGAYTLCAQSTITGTISADSGEPLIGANIISKADPSVGTVTDTDGNFRLNCELPITIKISYTGFSSQEVTVSDTNSPVEIALKEGFELGAVTVTARRRVEGIQETPISITAIQGVQLQEMGVEDLTGIADMAPNLTFSTAGTSSGNNSAAIVFIRGIGQFDFVPTSDPGVGIYVDEVYLGRTIGAVLDLVDLKSIEVIRGPQGTLFGRNTIGGALSLTSNDPKDSFGGRVSVTAGNYARNDVTLNLSGQLSEGIGLSFNAIRRNRRGYVERVNVADSWLGNDNMHGVKFNLNIAKPNSQFTLKLVGDYVIQREESAPEQNLFFHHDRQIPGLWNMGVGASTAEGYEPGNTTAGSNIYDERQNLGPFKTGETSLSQNDLDNWGISANLGYNIGKGWNSKLILAYRGLDNQFSRQVDGSPLNVFQNRNDFSQNQVSADFRLNKSTDKLDLVTGLFYFRENIGDYLRFGGVLDGVAWPAFVGGDVENSNYAAYGEGTYKLTDKFSVTAGLRYTNELKKARPDVVADGTLDIEQDEWPVVPDERNPDKTLVEDVDEEGNPIMVDPVDNPSRLIDRVWQENSFDQLTWRLNAAFKATDALNLYATVSTGFKSGGFEWRVTNASYYNDASNDIDGDGDGDLPQFEPETVTSYEIGAKFDAPNTDFRLNVAGFYSDYKNMQIAANPPGSIATFQTNAGDSEILGFEAEVIWIPNPSLLVNVGYGFTDAKYTKLIEGVTVTLEDKFIMTPKNMVTFGASYKIKMADKGSITPRIDGHYKSEMHFEFQNSAYSFDDGHTALNASLKYQTPNKHWEVILGIDNFTNELYLIGGDANTAIGYENGIYARPRNYYATFGYSF